MSADDVATLDVDSAIRVQVTPSQASYFAGEEFTVTITFTNTRTPESPKPRNTHRRGAHSISSAPLARPPTSPGHPRATALPSTFTRTPSNGCDVPTRKRLIGQGGAGTTSTTKGAQDVKGVLEQRRQNLLEKSRSLSVDIPARELLKNDAENGKNGRPQYVRAYSEFSEVGGERVSPTSLIDRGALMTVHQDYRQTSYPPRPCPARLISNFHHTTRMLGSSLCWTGRPSSVRCPPHRHHQPWPAPRRRRSRWPWIRSLNRLLRLTPVHPARAHRR